MASTSTEQPAEAGPSTSSATFASSSSSSEPTASGSSSSDATNATSTSTNTKARLEDLLGDSAEVNAENAPSTSTNAGADGDAGANGGGTDSTYECTICLETAKDAVVSMCGHLFCWPCLHQWLETRPQRQVCPVCKAAISRDKVIPLYGRDNKNQQDPRTKAPPRPTAQRTEPESSNFQGFGFPDGGGFHMSFGIGAFPFGFFTSSFNFGSEGRQPNATEEEQFLSKLFLWVGILFLAWLILA